MHLGQVVEGNSAFLVSKPCNVDFTRDNNGITGGGAPGSAL